jgi:hypothetical protein
MKLNKIAGALTAVAVLAATSCSDRPDGVLDKEQMTAFLVDFHKGEAVVNFQQGLYHNDSLKKIVKQSVYAKYGVTSAQVDSSLSYYGHHMEDYLEIYDDVIAQLETDVAQGDAGPSRVHAAGDSVNLWIDASRFRMDGKTPLRVLTYNVSAGNDSKPGDTYQLQYKIVSATHTSQRPEIETTIIGEYATGDMEYRIANTGSDGWVKMQFIADSTQVLDKVFGSVKFKIAPQTVMYIDSMALIRTRLIPENYHQRAGQRRSKVKK